MAKTLLDGVNEILKRAQLVRGDSGELTTLTDSARQIVIDLAIQVINEAQDELFALSDMAQPTEIKSGTITIVTGTRAYTLATDLNQLRWPLFDLTNNRYIWEDPGGYLGIVNRQAPPSNFTGISYTAAISPIDGTLYLEREPLASQNGDVYTYHYDKELVMSAATDAFQFTDVVFRAMVPAWTELFNATHKKQFSEGTYRKYLGQASKYLSRLHTPITYKPLGTRPNITDPLNPLTTSVDPFFG